MTEPSPHGGSRISPDGGAATDPFGRPIGRSSDAVDAFGRPVGRPTASAPESVSPTHVAEPTTAGPTPPTAPKPLGVPAGFSRSADVPAAPAPAPSSASMALVLGIGGLLFLPMLLSIPAWIVGARARRESRALPGRPGYGMATTGWLLGIFSTVFWLLMLVLGILGVVAFFNAWESAGTG